MAKIALGLILLVMFCVVSYNQWKLKRDTRIIVNRLKDLTSQIREIRQELDDGFVIMDNM